MKQALLAFALVATTVPPAAAGLYRWVDAAGVVHYTTEQDAIPEAHRGSATALDHPSAREGEPRPAEPASPNSVVPFAAGGPVIVEVYLNGAVLRLLLDTGADRTVIAPAALARAGIDASRGAPVWITGVTGSSPASLVGVQRLDVAGTRVGPLAVVAHTVPGDGLDGLLGRDVLDAFTVTFDAAGSRAILTPR